MQVTKTKKRTKGALLLESLKSNKKTDNQHADLPDCYMEGRHNMQSTTSDSLTTPKSKYWPPEELDDLYQIISTARADGELEETEFNSRMTAIFGTDVTDEGADDFLSFLDTLLQKTSQSGYSFDKNVFEEDMLKLLGDVSVNVKPIIPVTKVHIEKLRSLQMRLPQFTRAFVAWIQTLESHIGNSASTMSNNSEVTGRYYK